MALKKGSAAAKRWAKRMQKFRKKVHKTVKKPFQRRSKRPSLNHTHNTIIHHRISRTHSHRKQVKHEDIQHILIYGVLGGIGAGLLLSGNVSGNTTPPPPPPPPSPDVVNVALNVSTILPLTSASLTWSASATATPTINADSIINIAINWGDGATSNSAASGVTNPAQSFTASHTYSTYGTYTISVVATDNTGVKGTTSQNISIPTPSTTTTVAPAIATNYSAVTSGQTLQVVGDQFTPNGSVTIFYTNGAGDSGTLAATAISNSDFGPITIPYKSTGTYKIQAQDNATGINSNIVSVPVAGSTTTTTANLSGAYVVVATPNGLSATLTNFTSYARVLIVPSGPNAGIYTSGATTDAWIIKNNMTLYGLYSTPPYTLTTFAQLAAYLGLTYYSGGDQALALLGV